MALLYSVTIGNAVCHVYDDDLPKTKEEEAERRGVIASVCAQNYWAQEERRLRSEAKEA